MKVYISYFYKVRFMKSNLLPISTAKWDPDWYHQKPTIYRIPIKNYGLYVDKNGVLNGTRIESLVMPECLYKNIPENLSCSTDCERQGNCEFMKSYEEYLNTLNFDDVMFYLKAVANNYKYVYNINRDVDVILLVHEPSSCKCGERPVLKKWFKKHGVTLHEWSK